MGQMVLTSSRVIAAAMVVLIALFIGKALATKEVKLLTGSVFLEPADPGNPPVGQSVDRIAYPVNPWKDIPVAEFFLVGFDNFAQANAIRDNLSGSDTSLISYIPNNAFLVIGRADVVWDLVLRLNLCMAKYTATHKISPEWSPLLSVGLGPDDDLDSPNLPNTVKQQLDMLLSGIQTLKLLSGNDTVDAYAQFGVQVEMAPIATLEMVQYAARCWPQVVVRALRRSNKYTRKHPCWPVMTPPNAGTVLTVFLCKSPPAIAFWFRSPTLRDYSRASTAQQQSAGEGDNRTDHVQQEQQSCCMP
ncbi:hypothetical protein VOLCADRAFT_103854 [Volvox carteri f. nagariensis]|uniref:Uncharacterized protein n=1 Tax=Volvox carteri f. nagariensis TaxID=3068 RepID=D8TPN2_VOLCA|nr:uncharacterized protein VOLCADRAFT_103854 [Volvox carteri f. nagariensis]EFJ50794.1 hypothetical protein VOLCADRAFT_103854 [Volvox carteri f. nagariensis]|eukprot:XP_002948387.1 hypothetical protein VOLCADRAFT_103854 [Volvox carteri f. nagariensis]